MKCPITPRTCEVGAVQDPQNFKYNKYSRVINPEILGVQQYFRVSNPKKLLGQAVMRAIIPEILRVRAVSRSFEPWNTPSRRSTWSSLSPILVTLLQGTRSIYLQHPILIFYEHRLASAQDDPIRHTLRSMKPQLQPLFVQIFIRLVRNIHFCVTTAAAVSIILVFCD